VRLDEDALTRWGRRIGETVGRPVVLGLSGPLGAGKSVLARSIGAGAGVVEAMPSPSYNLMFRYPARTGTEVVHLDLYRVSDPDELWELGWEQLGEAHEIVIVEWPERAEGMMPPNYWVIELEVTPEDPTTREVSVRRVGAPPELGGFPMSVSGS